MPRSSPTAFHRNRLALARPGWQRDAQCFQRLRRSGTKLKPGAGGDRQAGPRPDGHHLFPLALPAPQLATTAEEVPELLDGAVDSGNRCLTRFELEFRHAAARLDQSDPQAS